MHIPDGFLDTKTVIATSVLSLAGLSFALRNIRKSVPRRQIPLMGLTAAFVFTAQMLNFPIGGGTSGHLIGAVLVAVLLGPSAAVIVMTSVLLVQAFFFADGGLLALGSNILNMAIIAPITGYALYKLILRFNRNNRGRIIGATFASWFTTVLASIFCVGELAISGTVPWKVALPSMGIAHAFIGIGEGIITALVLATILRIRPELCYDYNSKEIKTRPSFYIFEGIILILALILFVAPFASNLPDGLEKTAALLGFSSHTIKQTPVIPEKSFLGIQSEALSVIVAGLIGSVIVGILSVIIARVVIPANKKNLST